MGEAGWRLRAAVEEALELPREGWEALLRRRLDEEAEVAKALEILEGGLADDGFLGRRRGPEADRMMGLVLGGYRLVRVIGEGATGTVYEAQQHQPSRRVALKVLRDGLLRADGESRFRYEVEVLGSLEHPGIARIYDAGVEEVPGLSIRVPWIAMELVEEARTLRQHAEREGLDLEGRVDLFLEAANVVAHGHEHGVIHRDLKPDHLLVDASSRVRVIDFGVARMADPKALQATLRSRPGEIVGTLATMSPEQLRGEAADTRSDVYALGVVLYHLLVGAWPIDVAGDGFVTGARRVLEEAPRRPRAVRRDLPLDLEAVLLKALAKDRAGRYANAASLAEDLRAWRENRPVSARLPDLPHRLRLLWRRHRTAFVAGAVVLAALVAGTVVSLLFALRSRAAERDTAHWLRVAEEGEAEFRHLFSEQLQQNLDQVRTAAADVRPLFGGEQVARAMLFDAVQRLDALHAIAPDDPEVSLRLAEARAELARSVLVRSAREVDVLEAVERPLARAEALIDGLRARNPEEDALAWRIRVQVQLARAEAHLLHGDLEHARGHVDRVFDLLEEDTPHRSAPALLRAEAHRIAHEVASFGDRPSVALEHARARTAVLEGVREAGEDDVDLHRALGWAHYSEGTALRLLRRFDAAREATLEALAIFDDIATRWPSLRARIDRLQTVLQLGYVAMARGDRTSVRRRYLEAYEEAADLRRIAPEHVRVAELHAQALVGRGRIVTTDAVHDHARGSPERAAGLAEGLALFEQALAIYGKLAEDRQLDRDQRTSRDTLAEVVATLRPSSDR